MSKGAHQHIYVADGDSFVCDSIAAILEAQGYHPKTFQSGRALLKAFHSLPARSVIVDIDLDDVDAFDVMARVHAKDPGVPVVMMSSYGDVSMAVKAMKCGAADFLEKPFLPQTFLDQLECAIQDADSGDAPRSAPANGVGVEIRALPQRQKEILFRLMQGEHNKQIAFQLGISERTVETHRSRMMKRLGVHNLAELIKLALQADVNAG